MKRRTINRFYKKIQWEETICSINYLILIYFDSRLTSIELISIGSICSTMIDRLNFDQCHHSIDCEEYWLNRKMKKKIILMNIMKYFYQHLFSSPVDHHVQKYDQVMMKRICLAPPVLWLNLFNDRQYRSNDHLNLILNKEEKEVEQIFDFNHTWINFKWSITCDW